MYQIIHKARNSNFEIETKKNLLQCSDKHRDKNTFLVITYARTNAYYISSFPQVAFGLPEKNNNRKTKNFVLNFN